MIIRNRSEIEVMKLWIYYASPPTLAYEEVSNLACWFLCCLNRIRLDIIKHFDHQLQTLMLH